MTRSLLYSISVLMAVAACGKVPIDESHIKVSPEVAEQLSPNAALKNKVQVAEITTSSSVQDFNFDVNADSYKRVLIRTLKAQGYRAADAAHARYALTAQLQDISLSGVFDIEAHSQIAYQLIDKKDGVPVWFETINLPYVERYQFGADGSQKAQAAIEGALRENVTHMVRLLADATIPK